MRNQRHRRVRTPAYAYDGTNRPPATFAFRAPDGTIHRGENIRRFAREHGLDQACMQHVHSGDRIHHKGWTVVDD